VLRSRPVQAGADEVVRVSRADLLAQKHSWEVLSLQLVKADGSMLPIAALCGLLGVVRVVSGLGWGSYGAFEVVFG
jgi:hypothetical protein